MADGAFRFQAAGQYLFHPQSQAARGIHQRNGSPVNNPRLGFHNNTNNTSTSNETPSPNRSPGTNSPAYGMFGPNHQQNQHAALLNGQSHQQYQMRMNMAKHFGHQGSQHQNHHQSQQHHDHAGHNGAFGTHQHNISAGNLSSSTPHFTPSHLQSGTPLSSHSALSKPTSEHWQEQIRLAQQSRENTQPHFYARNAHVASRQALSSGQSATQKDEYHREDRRRMTMIDKGEKHAFTALDFGGQGLKGLSQNLFRYQFLEKLYFNANKLNWLTPQIGLLRSLTFLDLSQNQLSDLPPEIGMLVNLKTLLLFDNNLTDLPSEMGYLYQLDTLGLEGNPLNEDMRSIVAESGTGELIRTLREHAAGPPPPNERDWIVLDETPMASADPDRFCVLSYNILCHTYVTQAAYGYTPSGALAWENRREIILDELKARNADIICLQEVNAESFNDFFRPALAHDDYKGFFWPKSRAQTMSEKDARLVDGCATFYKNSKYVLLDKRLIEFGRIAINRPDMKGEHDIFNRVMTKDHIATACFLENRQTGARQIVANAHIFWDPVFVDVKIVQVAILLEQLGKMAQEWSKFPPCKDKELFKYANGDDVESEKAPVKTAPSQHYNSGTDIPLVSCVDFNSLPESSIYDLMANGSLSSTHEDLGGRSYGDLTRNGISHNFQLKSAYANIGELSFTNYTPGFIGCIDYIWYSTNALQVSGLLGEIDKEYLSRIPGFPHIYQPSDHIALMAEFSVKGRKEKKAVEADFGHR